MQIRKSIKESFSLPRNSVYYASNNEQTENIIPLHEIKSERHNLQCHQQYGTTESNQNDTVKKVKSLVGSFYRKSDKPTVQFKRTNRNKKKENPEGVRREEGEMQPPELNASNII